MKCTNYLLFAFILIFKTYGLPQSKTLVTIEDGALDGAIEISRAGTEYLAFKGIPYAKPPIGELRFKVSAFLLK